MLPPSTATSKLVVDGFQFASSSLTSVYFLTHFHADHYGGLKKSWSEGIIYCSMATARLVATKLYVEKRFIHPLPLNKVIDVLDGKGQRTNVKVVLLDANHCPGAVMFLFLLPGKQKKTVLHVGDFRWRGDVMAPQVMEARRKLLRPKDPNPNAPWDPLPTSPIPLPLLDYLYLDTTYLDPTKTLPTQRVAIEAAFDTVSRHLTQAATKRAKAIAEAEAARSKAAAGRRGAAGDGDVGAVGAVGAVGGDGDGGGGGGGSGQGWGSLSRGLKIDPTVGRTLVLFGSYTIGKERVFMEVAKRLDLKVRWPQHTPRFS